MYVAGLYRKYIHSDLINLVKLWVIVFLDIDSYHRNPFQFLL